MLSLSTKPIETKIMMDSKIIILTERQLIFSSLSSFENYLSISLIGTCPKKFHYSEETLQVFVETKNTLQVYYCDWKTAIEIKRIYFLESKKVRSVLYNPSSGWNVYVDQNIEAEPQITFHQIDEKSMNNDQYLGECFIKNSSYILTKNGLFFVSENGERKQIKWKDIGKITEKLQEEIEMEGKQQKKHCICINKKYLLLIQNFQVIQTIERENISYFDESFIINKHKNIQKISAKSKTQLKEQLEGSFCTGQLINGQFNFIEFVNQNLELKKIINEIEDSPAQEKEELFSSLGESFCIRKQKSAMETKTESKQIYELVKEIDGNNFSSQKIESMTSSQKFIKIDDSKSHQKKKNKTLSKSSSQKSKISQNLEPIETPGFKEDEEDLWSGKDFLKIQHSFQLKKNMSTVIKQEEFSDDQLCEQQTKKVVAFKPEGIPLTKKMAENIESLSYSSLLREVWSDNEQKFNRLFKEFSWELVEEQAYTFFAEFIKGQSQNEIKNEIRRIFSLDLDFEKKKKLTLALKEFKINQIPSQFLCFSNDFVHIIQILQIQIYLSDILKANKQIINIILESYLNLKEFQNVIILQDQSIDISNPRNFLNILLYLNQTFNLEVKDVLLIYCEKMIEYDYLEAILKVKEHKAFEICCVSSSLLDDLIINKLEEKFMKTDEQKLKQMVALLNKEKIDEYTIKLTIGQQLKKENLPFNLKELFSFHEESNRQQFLENILKENNGKQLKNVDFIRCLKGLHWLKNKQKFKSIDENFVKLIQMLSQKFAKEKMFHQSFTYLNKVIQQISPVFVAKLLFQHASSKFIHRLAKAKIKNLKTTFPQIFQSQATIDFIFDHSLDYPKKSDHFDCTFEEFQMAAQKYFSSLQLLLFIYEDFESAKELFSQLPENQTFNCLVDEVLGKKTKSEKSEDKKDNFSMNSSKQEDFLLLQTLKCKKRKEYFSEKAPSQSDNKPLMVSEIFSKGSENSWQDKMKENSRSLKESYETKGLATFLREIQQIQYGNYYHIEQLRVLSESLQFPVKQLFPFEIFEVRDEVMVFELSKDKIEEKLSIENFWVIFSIIQYVLGFGELINFIMIKKILLVYRSDEYFPIVETLLEETEFIGKDELKEILEMAKIFQLSETYQVIEKTLHKTFQ